jgi:AcrR family transcriptional regulator
MKYSSDKKETIATRRTLKSLKDTLITLLESKSFEDISVMDLCDSAMVPRTTFYNYFEDKYDLLRYSIQRLQSEMEPPEGSNDLTDENYINSLLDGVITYLTDNIKIFQKISKTNANNIVFSELQRYVEKDMLKRLNYIKSKNSKFEVPPELVAKFYSSAMVYTGQWWMENAAPYGKSDFLRYMKVLIETNKY